MGTFNMSEKQKVISEVKQKAVSGIFWRFAERILAQGVNILVSILLARLLLPEEYGVVAMVLIIINILNVLAVGGLGTSLIQKKDADELDFSTMFYTGIVISVGLYVFVFATAPLFSQIYKQPILTLVLRVIALRLPIASINSIQHAYVSKKLIFKKFFLATLVGTIVSAFVGISMAWKGFGVWALVGQYLTNVTIDTIMLFITLEWRPKLIFSYERMKSLLSYGWKVTATSFIGTVCNQLNGLIIGVKYAAVDLSCSSQGEKIPSFLAKNVESTLDSVLFPVMTMFQNDTKQMKAAVRRSMKTSAYIIMPLMFGLAAVSKSIVLIILSEEWLEAVPYMKIASIQHAFGMLGVVNLQAIKALGRSDISLKLEFMKKPFYFFIIFITMQISPLAMALGTAGYAIIASVINARPNIMLLKYTLKEQLMDISVPFMISCTMYVVVLNIERIGMGSLITLIVQIVVGLVYYIILSKKFDTESFNYIWNIVSKFIYKRKFK